MQFDPQYSENIIRNYQLLKEKKQKTTYNNSNSKNSQLDKLILKDSKVSRNRNETATNNISKLSKNDSKNDSKNGSFIINNHNSNLNQNVSQGNINISNGNGVPNNNSQFKISKAVQQVEIFLSTESICTTQVNSKNEKGSENFIKLNNNKQANHLNIDIRCKTEGKEREENNEKEGNNTEREMNKDKASNELKYDKYRKISNISNVKKETSSSNTEHDNRKYTNANNDFMQKNSKKLFNLKKKNKPRLNILSQPNYFNSENENEGNDQSILTIDINNESRIDNERMIDLKLCNDAHKMLMEYEHIILETSKREDKENEKESVKKYKNSIENDIDEITQIYDDVEKKMSREDYNLNEDLKYINNKKNSDEDRDKNKDLLNDSLNENSYKDNKNYDLIVNDSIIKEMNMDYVESPIKSIISDKERTKTIKLVDIEYRLVKNNNSTNNILNLLGTNDGNFDNKSNKNKVSYDNIACANMSKNYKTENTRSNSLYISSSNKQKLIKKNYNIDSNRQENIINEEVSVLNEREILLQTIVNELGNDLFMDLYDIIDKNTPQEFFFYDEDLIKSKIRVSLNEKYNNDRLMKGFQMIYEIYKVIFLTREEKIKISLNEMNEEN